MRRPAPVAGITVAVVLAVAGSALAAPATTLWTKRYNGPGNGDDGATSVAASPDGTRMFVTGGSTGSTTGVDYTTIAYDTATGSRLWTRRYNGPGNGDDLARSVTVGPDGATVFVTGSSTGSTDTDYATIAYTVSTGAVLWTARYDGGFANEDFAHSLAVSPDGTRVFVTGESRGSSIYADYATIAYDASTGAPLWTKRYNGSGNGDDVARSVAVSPDGTTVFVTGGSLGSSTTGRDYATVAYNAATGATNWTRRYTGYANGNDLPYAVRVSPDGTRVFVTGSAAGPPSTNYDYATLAYDASSGTILWTTRYNGPGADTAYSLAVSPDGTRVFVTGQSLEYPTGDDYLTIAYDALTGVALGGARYNGPGNGTDDAFSVAVSPDGTRLFVTGQSAGSGTGFDYATIAYSV